MCSFGHLGQKFGAFLVAGASKRRQLEQDGVRWGGTWRTKWTATLIYPSAKIPIEAENCTKSVKKGCRSVLEHDS